MSSSEKMNMSEKITLVSICDNNYAVMLCALLWSIKQNHRTGEPIEYHIIDDRISDLNKDRIERSVAGPAFVINWIPLNAALPAAARVPLDFSMYPINIYARLFIAETLPDLDRVIYLDVDILVNGEISELWNVDLQGKIAGAVLDPFETFDHPLAVANYRELDLPGKSPYFNSGVLVLDLLKWKKRNLGEEILNLIQKNSRYAGFPDQYGLNVALANEWTPIDPSWNGFAPFAYDELPKLIHFILKKPIYWDYKGNMSFRKLFFTYLRQTEMRRFRSRGPARRIVKKVMNKIKKFWLRKFPKNQAV
ncbi:glycosyltransferase family 8 protein [Pedobacter sp. SYP-B3415]|uniref:glycosyltransferase family 8 protein n=1 Tax=Pedobacter sp. SYP-B3415 TaxID=2496641 RepID=UPI00101CDB55|nr:glycosyltransferase family 8 protein [Pedobacter sp. SYP-B3415]